MAVKKPEIKKTWLEDLNSKDISFENGRLGLVDEPLPVEGKHLLRRQITWFAFAVLSIVVIGWAAASIVFQKVQLGDLLIIGRQSDQSLESSIRDKTNTYKLSILYPNGSKKDYSLAEMGFEINYQATVAEIRHRQHQFTSQFIWWRPVTANLAITSSKGLNKFINDKTYIVIQPANDAKLTLSHGRVHIVNSTEGKHYGLLNPAGTLIGSVSILNSSPLKLETLSTRPAISSKQLEPYQKKLDSILSQKIVFTIEGTKVKPTSSDIGDWVEITPKLIGKGIDITVNSGKVLAYINNISAGYIHPPQSKVVFKRDDGTQTVLAQGINGTDITNKATVAKDVAAKLMNGQTIQSDLQVKYARYDTVTAGEYQKWIEVDVTNKVMYLYEKSKMIKSYLISAGAPATPTVIGNFTIQRKYVQQDMKGFNVDGSQYFQPHVAWINYFYGGYAIHGNYWRPLSWFGNINSSHGCVSLPDNLAQQVYDWAPLGTHVIVHA